VISDFLGEILSLHMKRKLNVSKNAKYFDFSKMDKDKCPKMDCRKCPY
jgi:hypothetical protein